MPATTGLSTLRQQFSTPLIILMLVVATVLLIACANVGSLALSQAAARTPEFSMRLALGAGSWRLIRQLLTEHLLLASIGGVLRTGPGTMGHWCARRVHVVGPRTNRAEPDTRSARAGVHRCDLDPHWRPLRSGAGAAASPRRRHCRASPSTAWRRQPATGCDPAGCSSQGKWRCL